MRRWTRYGHDRLYVQTADGTRLGYWDCKAHAPVVEPGTDRAAFDAAIAAHLGATAVPDQACAPMVPQQGTAPDVPLPTVPPPVAATAPAVEPQDEPESAQAAWTDLASVRAGAAAREQALALKQAAPVRTFLARALGVKTDERAWRIGADGEQAVAARLARLGDRWRVLHAVPVGESGSDIDHVVIGPGGVFTVNAKHHPDASIWVGGDTFLVNGQRVPYVRNSRFEARRTAKLLTAAGAPPTAVTALIAVMGATGGWTIKAQPADGQVVVVARKEIHKWLAGRPAVLSDDQVDAIFGVARRSDTWR